MAEENIIFVCVCVLLVYTMNISPRGVDLDNIKIIKGLKRWSLGKVLAIQNWGHEFNFKVHVK